MKVNFIGNVSTKFNALRRYTLVSALALGIGIARDQYYRILVIGWLAWYRSNPRHITLSSWLCGVLKDVQLTAQEVWTEADNHEGWRAQRSFADYAF